MILPGTEKLEGIIGTTFDFVVTLYPSEYASLKWSAKNSEYNSEKTYEKNVVVIASNASAYRALKENAGQNPISATEYWEKLTPLNLTGYKAWLNIGSGLELKVGSGITLGAAAGTVSVKATKAQTEVFIPSSAPASLFLEDTESNYYEYLIGPIKWKLQNWKS